MIDYKLIGLRLKMSREKVNMTQESVAEQSDITVVYLSKIENGRVRPTLEILNTICSVVNCDLGSLFLNVSTESQNYQNEEIVELFRKCSPSVKPIAIDLLRKLSEL